LVALTSCRLFRNATRFILSEAKDLNPSLHRPRHNARPQILKRREQAAYRIFFQIFLLREVFNTSVDKYVEKTVFSKANYTFLSILTRFALFRCKSRPKTYRTSSSLFPASKKKCVSKKQFFERHSTQYVPPPQLRTLKFFYVFSTISPVCPNEF
jgi:hypothetical protein